MAFPFSLSGWRFKGDRDYLHGTDILPATLNVLKGEQIPNAITNIDIVFHALARTCLTLSASAPPGAAINAQLKCDINGERKKFVLTEDGRPILERCAYPEDQIVAATDISPAAGTATCAVALPFTNIERWVAMVKALHQAVYPEARGKWLFVRGRFDGYEEQCQTGAKHQVIVESSFGNKLTRSTLLIDGQKRGDIFFALA